MARQIITVLTDDLDGGDAARTVEFGLDGVSYMIDLSQKNAGKLRKSLEPYLAVAAALPGRGTSRLRRTRNSSPHSSRPKNGSA
jgi:hypothetical protein